MNLRKSSLLLSFCILLAPVLIVECAAQNPGNPGQKAGAAHTPVDQDKSQLRKLLLDTDAVVYQSDGKALYMEERFSYADVEFPEPCKLNFGEQRKFSGSVKREHTYTPRAIELGKISVPKNAPEHYSSAHAALPGLHYTVDAWVLTLENSDAPQFVFETSRQATEFLSLLNRVAAKCQSSPQ